MMGKHRPKVLDKSVKRKIFGHRMHEVTEKWIKLHKGQIKYVFPQQILVYFIEVEMGGRSETHWGREMYRENYIFNRYSESNIVCTNYKSKTGNMKYRANRIPHSARHTSLLQSPQQPDLKRIEARGQSLNIQQHGEICYFHLFFYTGSTTHCGFVFCSPLAGL